MSMFDRQNLKKTPRVAFQVSAHALERFRERVEEEFTHRADDDLADLLNARLTAPISVGDVVDPRAPDTVTRLYSFECRTGTKLVAVVRDRNVITVLDDWMAQNNYPGWDGPRPPLGTLGSIAGDKLRGIVVVPPDGVMMLAPPAPQSDAYLALADDCRRLAATLKRMRDQKIELEQQLTAATDSIAQHETEFAIKRDLLLSLMSEGTP